MSYYWTDFEIESLKDVDSFEDMVDVGLSILDRMQGVGRPIVQICGPMTTGGRGSLRANMAYFKKAQAVAIKNGMILFDQTPFEDSMVRLSAKSTKPGYCYEILHIFYRRIFRSELLHELSFLPDWSTSVGATWEREEGSLIGLTISEYPNEWLEFIEA